MSRTIEFEELKSASDLSQWCDADSDPIFVSSNGKDEMVLLNIASYRQLFARAQVYQKLEEGEADVAAGRESDAFEMLKRMEA